MSYLNTAPLVWGFLHGPQVGTFDLRFELPSVCARSMAEGTAEIGLIPSIEAARQGLGTLPGLGIASDGPVRSILLIARTEPQKIRSVAMDQGSRTSVVLAKIILALRYGVTNIQARTALPEYEAMLETADAALIIGDPALHFDPANSSFLVLDLGQEWQRLTGLPMVYAQWAGKFSSDAARTFEASHHFGMTHLEDILREEARPRGFSNELAQEYLTRHIVYRLDHRHSQGLEHYLAFARELKLL